MPELPEVETTRLGIAPHLLGRRISNLVIRQARLRWPIPKQLIATLPGQRIESIERRAKYLLVHTQAGSALLHLGMSGSLRVLDPETIAGKHDHYDWLLDSGRLLRFTDPRRFGSLLWQPVGHMHELLAHLGPEPLDDAFDGDHLWQRSRGRSAAIKTFIMDQAIVVGVGNIYAAEALFAAGINPRRKAGAVSRERYAKLAEAIKRILGHAIQRGGTTLRDFISPDGVPGYFEQELYVYGRVGKACRNCGTPIRSITLGQRSTFFCGRCQR
ncbi:MAG: bifunctional DNA-formamidopyrimidine glycosylase/DNA-(apurinic or apyrimidinic site) lyase [Xanthomonadales bacterium]|nr:bifunctional DNA-formamidopyrimidine glycosylase/DNA-(apurinic or apyrimidinic site) lyase [Xanthomonadales bacterium]